MRERSDPGPIIFNSGEEYRIVVENKVIACEQQTCASALAKLLKVYFVHNLQLPQFRRAMMTMIALCFGVRGKYSSCFKEVVNCVMAAEPTSVTLVWALDVVFVCRYWLLECFLCFKCYLESSATKLLLIKVLMRLLVSQTCDSQIYCFLFCLQSTIQWLQETRRATVH